MTVDWIDPEARDYYIQHVKIPAPTRTFGPVPIGIVPNRYPRGATRGEVESRPVVDAALAVRDPWGGRLDDR